MPEALEVETPLASHAVDATLAIEGRGDVACMINALRFLWEAGSVLAELGLDYEELREQAEEVAAEIIRVLGLGYREGAAYYASLRLHDSIQLASVLGPERLEELLHAVVGGSCEDAREALLVLLDAARPEPALTDYVSKVASDCDAVRLMALLLLAIPPASRR